MRTSCPKTREHRRNNSRNSPATENPQTASLWPGIPGGRYRPLAGDDMPKIHRPQRAGPDGWGFALDVCSDLCADAAGKRSVFGRCTPFKKRVGGVIPAGG